MTNIPYKPLSERMLEEPFWLGLITVVIVLIIIGICYLLKKHLPDRIEKFLIDADNIESGKLVGTNNSSTNNERSYYGESRELDSLCLLYTSPSPRDS